MFDEKDNLFLLKDIEVSVERILKAITKKENILVFGDCDTDGITSTAMLYDFLTQIGGRVSYYVLNRNTESYGLSEIAVNNFLNMRPKLVITVDCGTTDIRSVKKLKEQGIDTIITDHHECGNELPDAVGIINPKVHDKYLSRELAGVGVVLKLIIALCKKKKLEEECYLRYMDIVALGTIADGVSITDYDNAKILERGITRIIRNPSIGIKKLLGRSSLIHKYCSTSIDFEDARNIIKWNIVSLLNARWKSDQDVKICVELLTKDYVTRAAEIISELNKNKQESKLVEEEIGKSAERIIREDIERKISTQVQNKDKIIVVSVEDCEERVRGRVAYKLRKKYEEFCKAAIVCTMKNGMLKGTGRSDEEFNLFRVLVGCKENKLLQDYSGHTFTCGFTSNEENIVRLKEHMINIIKITEQSARTIEEYANNKKVKEIELTIEKAQMLKDLKAQGIFSSHSLRIVDYKQMPNKDNYMLLVLKCKDTCCIEAIASEEIGAINVIQKNNDVDIKFKIREFENTSWIEIQEINLSKINDRQIKTQKLEIIEIDARGITLDNAKRLRDLNLLGQNPLFLCRGMKIVEDPQISINGNCLKLVLAGNDNQNIDAVWFGKGKDLVDELEKGDVVDVQFEYNENNGDIQMRIKDLTLIQEYLEDEKVIEITSDEIDKIICKKNLRKYKYRYSSFLCRGMKIMEDPLVLFNNHLGLQLAGDNERSWKAIWFDKKNDLINDLKKGDVVDVRFKGKDSWNRIKIQNLRILGKKLDNLGDKNGLEELDEKVIEITSDEIDSAITKKNLQGFGYIYSPFLCRGMEIVEDPLVISDKHLILQLAGDNKNWEAIWFNKGNDVVDELKKGDLVDIRFETKDFFEKKQLKIQNLRVLRKKLKNLVNSKDLQGSNVIQIKADEMVIDRINVLKDLCSISVFSCRGLRVLDWYQKAGNDLKLVLSGDNTPSINATVSSAEDKISSFKRGTYVDIEFNVTDSTSNVELKIRKLKISERTFEVVEINSNGMTSDNIKKLSRINLFKNADPIFLCRNMKVTNYPQKIQNSLRLELSNNNHTNIYTNIDAIACELGDMAGYIKRNDQVDVAFEMAEYNNDAQIRIKAMRLQEWLYKSDKQMKNKKNIVSRKRTIVEPVNTSNKRIKHLEKNLNHINQPGTSCDLYDYEQWDMTLDEMLKDM